MTAAGHDEDLDLIRDAAAEAARIAMGFFRADPDVWMKSGQSPVSEADIAVDDFLRRRLSKARPDYGWLSEESERSFQMDNAHRTFVVDPIDGTRAFLNGDDQWCVSVAIVASGRSLAGVLNCPVRGEEFTARLNGGAFCGDQAIAVSKAPQNPHIGGPKRMIEALPQALRTTVREGRYVPSLAYRVAMVARGDLDATFVKPNAHDWDLAAADLILEEAGGIVLDAQAKRPYYAGRNPRLGALTAGSGPLAAELASVLSRFDV